MEHGGQSSQHEELELRPGDSVVFLASLCIVLHIVNNRYFKWPPSIFLAFGAICCTTIVLFLSLIPGLGVSRILDNFRSSFLDFPDLVLNYMLGFLLFAAAIEVDIRQMGRIASTIFALSFGTTILSAAIVAVLTYLMMQRVAALDFRWCMLYGAIVSPTDPVAVISILNEKKNLLKASVRLFVIGESLLNDALGVLLYLISSAVVLNPDIAFNEVILLFVKGLFKEGVLGIVIGVALSWLAYSAIRVVDDMLVEVAITFVLVANINLWCRLFDASIPLASVAAGLLIGNWGVEFGFSPRATDTFREMWKMLDEALNSMLFLLIGAADLLWEPQGLGFFKVLVIVVGTICISLFARLVSVAIPLLLIVFLEWLTGRRLRHPSVMYRGGTIAVLTWGGMRGGISIALALGVPDAFAPSAVAGHVTFGQLIFFMTFSLVVFSICIQGLFFEPVVRHIEALSHAYLQSGGLDTYRSQIDLIEASTGERYDDEDPNYAVFDGDYVVEPTGFAEGGERMQMEFTGGWDAQEDVIEDGDGWEFDEDDPYPGPAMGGFRSMPVNSSDLFEDPIAPSEHVVEPIASPSLQPSSLRHLYMRDSGPRQGDSVRSPNMPPLPPHVQNPQHAPYMSRRVSQLRRAEKSSNPHEKQVSRTFEGLDPLREIPSIDHVVRQGSTNLRDWFTGRQRSQLADQSKEENSGGSLRRSRTVPSEIAAQQRADSDRQQQNNAETGAHSQTDSFLGFGGRTVNRRRSRF